MVGDGKPKRLRATDSLKNPEKRIASLFKPLCESDSDDDLPNGLLDSKASPEEAFGSQLSPDTVGFAAASPTFQESIQSVNERKRSPSASSPEAFGTVTSSLTSELNSNEVLNTSEGVNTSKKEVTFESLGVCQELCNACAALGWERPTEIQAEALPYALDGRDVIGLAETGSGKTGAFALPIVQSLLDNPRHRGIFALILAPTRELTVQIAEQFQALGSSVSLKVCTIVGGLDMVTQAMELTKKPHILVGTPGRIIDHLENTKGFTLGTIRFLVMDEADRLLSMDFEDALTKILDVLPKERNTYLFSATMTSRVSKLQRASLVKPVKVAVNTKYDTAKNLVQYMKIIGYKFKWPYCIGLLTYLKAYTTMIFSNTCLDAKRLAIGLRNLGFQAVCLHGKMTQPQRLAALNGFKSGQKKVLVATEVGSRGLDIPHVDIVINFDVPLTSKDYIHRVGRTARAGKTGRSITLVTQYDAETYLKIEQTLGKKLEPYNDVGEDLWQPLIEKVEEIRRLTEHELKEAESTKKGGFKGSRKNYQKKRL